MKVVVLTSTFILKWFFIWNSGGGPNLGGNWTIRNAQTCNHLYPSKTSFIWDIWNTSDGFLQVTFLPYRGSYCLLVLFCDRFSCPQTYQSLGLRTGSPSSTVMFLEPANVTDPKQLLWLLNPTPVLSTNCSNDTNS